MQPDFALIVVEGRDDGGLVPGDGIEFHGNAELQVPGVGRLDMAIGFTVTDISATTGFVANSLTLSSHIATGSAFVTVGEFVTDASGVGLGLKEVDSDPLLSDSFDISAGETELIIEDDLLMVSGSAFDSAVLATFEQRFALPEPERPVMLGAGLVGLFALHQLRRRRSAAGRRISST